MTSQIEWQELRAFAREAALQAGALIRRRWDDPRIVEHKSAIDLVTDCDRAAEECIAAAITKRFSGHAILAEEGTGTGSLDAEYCWIVDPLDGTTNWVHGLPHVAVSLAVAHRGTVVGGAVYDPLRDEMFHAARGHGALLNERPIRVSPVRTLDSALLATGFPYDCRERADFYLAFLRAVMQVARGIRRIGSAALDLSYVACGRLDAFWEWKLKPWDTAAGMLLVEEAGGRTSDFTGAPHDLLGEQTLASNGRLHAEMLRVLRQPLASAHPR